MDIATSGVVLVRSGYLFFVAIAGFVGRKRYSFLRMIVLSVQ